MITTACHLHIPLDSLRPPALPPSPLICDLCDDRVFGVLYRAAGVMLIRRLIQEERSDLSEVEERKKVLQGLKDKDADGADIRNAVSVLTRWNEP